MELELRQRDPHLKAGVECVWKDQRNGVGVATRGDVAARFGLDGGKTSAMELELRHHRLGAPRPAAAPWKDQRNGVGVATAPVPTASRHWSRGGKTSAMSLELRGDRIADGRLPAYRWKDQRNGFGIATCCRLKRPEGIVEVPAQRNGIATSFTRRWKDQRNGMGLRRGRCSWMERPAQRKELGG